MSSYPSDFASSGDCAFVREATPNGETVHVYGDLDLGELDQFERVSGDACATGGVVALDLRECVYFGAAAFSVVQRMRVVVPGDGLPARLLVVLRSQAAFAVVRSF